MILIATDSDRRKINFVREFFVGQYFFTIADKKIRMKLLTLKDVKNNLN